MLTQPNFRSRYDLDNLPDTEVEIVDVLAIVQAEIDEITSQLAEMEDGDADWEARAVGARKLRFIVRAKLNAKLTQANRQASERNMRLAHELKMERITASSSRERDRLAALMAWMKAAHPDLLPQAYAVLDAAHPAGE